jgi:RNA 3'-terminal phosphate cyclase (ATP)
LVEVLRIDGSHGEGGGQLLRTALSLATIAGREIEIHDLRGGRDEPGLGAQHLTAVRAAAALCEARVEGDELGSRELRFAPRGPVRPGDYRFDVAAARHGGSAGAATLVLQTILLPLALARGTSTVSIRGGTHVAWSPSFDYVREVWLPALTRVGVSADLELVCWGWFPVGEGELRAQIRGRSRPLESLDLSERGNLLRVSGRAVAANLPAHIPQRMADRARKLLEAAGIATRIEPLRVRAACPGAGLFLTAEYERVRAGFSSLGERGKPSETVAEEAAAQLLEHRDSGASLDAYLADQLIAPLALADDTSHLSVERISTHLTTSAWVAEKFGLAQVHVEAAPGGVGLLRIDPADPYARARLDMVRYQLEARDISDGRVLEAMRNVRRDLFVPPELRDLAYEDRPLPIGNGQTISQPYIVALMTQLAMASGAHRALDVGTGSGYQAAVLAELVDEVYTIEFVPELAQQAAGRLEHLANVHTRCGDGRKGWPEAAPFDLIIAACAARDVPEALISQLAPGGRLVIPTGSTFQELVLVEKNADGAIRRSSHGGVAFVPMVGGEPL